MQHSFGITAPGFRLPADTSIGAIRLLVSDFARSIHFYETLLGFRVIDRTPDAAVLGAQDAGVVGGPLRPVLRLQGGEGVKPSPGGAVGLYHFAIVLPDRASLAGFASHLARLHVRAGMADHLVSEALYLSDPDGLGIEVYADRPRAEWRYEARELVMTTEPLDVKSLVEAAGAHAWQGMPAGTRVGHIHLHVGSLREAEAFYHAALGLDKVVWSYPGALFFAAGGYHHHLGTNTWGSGDRPADDEARLLHWELVVPGHGQAEAAARSLADAGYDVERRENGWTTADPFGTRLNIISLKV